MRTNERYTVTEEQLAKAVMLSDAMMNREALIKQIGQVHVASRDARNNEEYRASVDATFRVLGLCDASVEAKLAAIALVLSDLIDIQARDRAAFAAI